MKQYIEIKTLENIYPYQAKKIIAKGTIKAVLTMGTISAKAKELFYQAEILWVENIPESMFRSSETQPEDRNS
ncbi:MAG: hypothetical protein WBB29_23200 [Geitlerinemataceae cyanobacterium]